MRKIDGPCVQLRSLLGGASPLGASAARCGGADADADEADEADEAARHGELAAPGAPCCSESSTLTSGLLVRWRSRTIQSRMEKSCELHLGFSWSTADSSEREPPPTCQSPRTDSSAKSRWPPMVCRRRMFFFLLRPSGDRLLWLPTPNMSSTERRRRTFSRSVILSFHGGSALSGSRLPVERPSAAPGAHGGPPASRSLQAPSSDDSLTVFCWAAFFLESVSHSMSRARGASRCSGFPTANTDRSLSLSVSIGRPSLTSSLRSSSASSPPRLSAADRASGPRAPSSAPVRKVMEEVVE
ncbi:hypothetical protein EYF80_044897 [Liparis tanakae]|uniref:Uncharacterized protein n=1 Tax=Liparis tanakae TaxID=230148 RepID=A0A4Z2FX34_9TELE|nr:hypothetical protein EYF80_044897 [Liparis tanakae]